MENPLRKVEKSVPLFVTHPSWRGALDAIWAAHIHPLVTDLGFYQGVPGGLVSVHEAYAKTCPLAFTGPGAAQAMTSPAYAQGYAIARADSSSRELSTVWTPLLQQMNARAAQSGQSLSDLIRSDENLWRKFEHDWFADLFDRVLKPHGLDQAMLVWDWTVLPFGLTQPEATDVLPGHWTVNLRHPPSYPKVVISLRSATNLTPTIDLLSAEATSSVTALSGYVGVPPTYIDDLATITPPAPAHEIFSYRPDDSVALLYWPGRALHRELPKNGEIEFALCFSLMPAHDLNRAANRESYDLAVRPFAGANAYAPCYIDRQSFDQSPASSLLWDGKIAQGTRASILLQAIKPYFDRLADEQDRDAFYFLAFLIQFVAVDDIDQTLGEIDKLCRSYLTAAQLAAFTAYTDDLRYDFMRFFHPRVKEVGFWPNPVHESHPKPLIGAKPYVHKTPILTADTRVATAGSCFAFEISAMLQKRGYNYLITERPDNPRDGVIVAEYTPGDKLVKFSASYGLLFNSPSLLQLAQRAFGLKTFKRLLVPEGEFLADPFRENVFFLDQASFDRDYDRHTEALRRVFTEAEVFVFTMGLNEYWRYKDDHTAISRNPRSTIVALLEHRRMTVAENVQAISKFHRIVKVHNPNFKMILSVSPIPFLASGLSQKLHVIQANSHSKAVLRVAAQELAETLEDVYYFPSFEMVMHTLADPWEEDMRHVKREAVSEIIELFYEMYQH